MYPKMGQINQRVAYSQTGPVNLGMTSLCWHDTMLLTQIWVKLTICVGSYSNGIQYEK